MKRISTGDISGAVADLGVLVPLAAALVVVNHLDPGPVLLVAGAFVIGSGLSFGIPFPVQPLKALTALAVARELSPEVIHAAGLEIGFILLLLAVTGLADRVATVFTKPVIRSLQFGVGVLLIRTAVRLAADPPGVFTGVPSLSWRLALAVLTLAVVGVAAWRHWYAVGALVLGAGIVVGWIASAPHLGSVAPSLPTPAWPGFSHWGTAFVLLVIPQIPLTYGNAIVGVSDLAREHFGERAARVTPGRVSLSCALGNLTSGVLGGMPMCHGSSGFSAHVRLGASTPAMSLLLGGLLIALGVVFPAQVLALFGVLPIWVLAGFLAYAGVRHAGLVVDLRGSRLVVAIAAGLIGVATGNLAYTTGAALAVEHGPRMLGRGRELPAAPKGRGDGA